MANEFILNYNVITIKAPLEQWKDTVNFYINFEFDLMFEDPKQQIAELQVSPGFYFRIEGKSNFKPPKNFHVTLAITNSKQYLQILKKKGFNSISPLKKSGTLEISFTVTDPNGYHLRFAEYEHGPPEWKLSLLQKNNNKNN